MARKTLSLKTKLASALLALGHIPYDDAKQMTEDQLVSLYHFDHGMLHESGHPQRDMYWNITPRLLKAHRDKTKLDAAIIAKGRRIRARGPALPAILAAADEIIAEGGPIPTQEEFSRRVRKLRSRGFDRTRRRHMDGTVTKR